MAHPAPDTFRRLAVPVKPEQALSSSGSTVLNASIFMFYLMSSALMHMPPPSPPSLPSRPTLSLLCSCAAPP